MEEKYSKKIKSPIYEPKNEKPNIELLVNQEKSRNLIKDIESSNIPEEEKTFLKLAAQRHLIFNYALIADFYAHSSKTVQELMEKSALVIIDFNKAVENGYVKVSQKILDQYKEENE